MIVSFRCRATEELFYDLKPKKLPSSILNVARRKLLMLDAAVRVEDLRIPPGNRLEKLTRGRKGQYSIRINDQWRICFEFEVGQAKKVEIVDYHR